MTTTTDLINLLKKYEKGASGRSRELSFQIKINGGKEKYINSIDISFLGSSDGCAGAELLLKLNAVT